METWAVPKRAGMGALYGVGLGFLAGGMEMVALAASQSLALSILQFGLLGLTAALLMGMVAGLIGLLTGPLHVVLARARPSTALALHLTLIAFLLCGYYLWQAAYGIYTDERAPAAAAMAAMPIGFTGVVYFNARFFLRRFEIGKPMGVPWLPAAFGGAVALIGLSAVFQGFRDTGGPHALEDDRNVVFVTVHGWSEPGASTLQAFDDGVHFANAVTPDPAARSAAATLLTGLHPLRHRLLTDDDPLPWHYTSLAEVLALEGYATGAFVSQHPMLAASGLEQGFRVYDDDFSPVVPGLLRLNLARNLLGTQGWERPSATTVDRFEGWLDAKSAFPFFAWIHLGPDDVDAQLLRIHDALEPVADETFVVFTATSGVPTRTESVLHDDRIRVPLLVQLPGVERKNTTVPQQVRLMDLAITATTWLGVEAPENEGIDLSGFLTGTRNRTIGSTLVGRTDEGRYQLGLRNNGVKFIRDHGSEEGMLFRLEDDPGETRDLSEEQPDAFEQARRILGPDAVRLDRLVP